MTVVSLTFSTTSGTSGPPIYLPQSAGTLTPDTESSVLDIYIRHNGANSITDLKYYMIPYAAGVYRGTATAQEDFDQLIGWGDETNGTPPYGVQVKASADAGYTQIKTGAGDSLANAITYGSGTIAHEGVDNMKLKIKPPELADAGEGGTKYFDLMFTYTYTS